MTNRTTTNNDLQITTHKIIERAACTTLKTAPAPPVAPIELFLLQTR
jgi:hypothetical protein